MSVESGVVIIGRNEGERLRACLRSAVSGKLKVASGGISVIYVDSGSNDGSVELAQSVGAEVVVVQPPFSAAKARNAGFTRLLELAPETQYVQFVDGDCTVTEGWLEAARQFLEGNPQYAVVAGRLRERYPQHSKYNRLCDMEWNTPVGEAAACGGIAMYRMEAFQAVGGFDGTVIAGEEPEFCLRLRRLGWKIRRLDAEMALHDAAMTRFGQWWKRAVRAGYSYALGKAMHGRSDQYRVKETRSNWFWGLALPVVALGLAYPSGGLSLLLLLAYAVLTWRIYRHMRCRGFPTSDARLYAFLCTLSKFPQAHGQLRFWWGRLRSRPSRIIEYKQAAAPARQPS